MVFDIKDIAKSAKEDFNDTIGSEKFWDDIGDAIKEAIGTIVGGLKDLLDNIDISHIFNKFFEFLSKISEFFRMFLSTPLGIEFN